MDRGGLHGAIFTGQQDCRALAGCRLQQPKGTALDRALRQRERRLLRETKDCKRRDLRSKAVEMEPLMSQADLTPLSPL
jgi:hypothetical protein